MHPFIKDSGTYHHLHPPSQNLTQGQPLTINTIQIPEDISLNKVAAKEKFKKCHRNRGLPIYTFYHYARLQKEEEEKQNKKT